MQRYINFFALGCIVLAAGVGMGAFAAHGLKTTLSSHYLAVFQTAVTYQMYHGLGLVLAGVSSHNHLKLFQIGGNLLFIGIVLFSGSLYCLTLFDLPKLGMITPFGGMAFILGWLCLAVSALKTTKTDKETTT
jgi:uncharacterized membrane protein YgdD (TMEM256/DUF423 family)